MFKVAGHFWLWCGEESMAKVCVSCEGNGEGFGGVEEVSSVLWVQFEGEDCAKALAFEREGC